MEKRKFDSFSTIFKKMDYNSNNVVPTKFAQVVTLNVAQVSMMPIAIPISISLGETLEKFNRLSFKRWQQKRLFYLTTLNLARFLIEDTPKLKEDECDIQVINVVES